MFDCSILDVQLGSRYTVEYAALLQRLNQFFLSASFNFLFFHRGSGDSPLLLNIMMVTFIAVTDFKIWATRNNYSAKKPTNSHMEVFIIDKVWNANTFQAFCFNLLSRDKESSLKWSDMRQETITNSFGHCKRWLILVKFT